MKEIKLLPKIAPERMFGILPYYDGNQVLTSESGEIQFDLEKKGVWKVSASGSCQIGKLEIPDAWIRGWNKLFQFRGSILSGRFALSVCRRGCVFWRRTVYKIRDTSTGQVYEATRRFGWKIHFGEMFSLSYKDECVLVVLMVQDEETENLSLIVGSLLFHQGLQASASRD